MIQSMTSFARTSLSGEGTMTWEIRTVNHRYLEMSLRLPEEARQFEKEIRDCISAKLLRGRIEVTLTYQQNSGSSQELNINYDLAKQIIQSCESLQEHMTYPAPLAATEILRWPGVIQGKDGINMEELKVNLLISLNQCVDEIIRVRGVEGEKLTVFLNEKLTAMQSEIKHIVTNIPLTISGYKERLRQRCEEASVTLNEERLEQEILLLVQKSDVKEELERLQTHISEVAQILKVGGSVGRRLDFLMQELNRESNTIGSKSVSAEITSRVVELKVLIEQMREQIQNIE